MGSNIAVRPVRLVNIVSYGAADVVGAGAAGVIAGWLLFFYTGFCGLGAAEAAAIFAIARIIDALMSPVIGHISDNFHHTALGRRFGRRRIFLLLALPLLPSFALMWVSGQSFWYYLATYVFFDIVYAAVLIPYETLAPGMTRDFSMRARLAGSRLVVGQFASLLAGALPSLIIAQMGRENAETFLFQGAIFSGLFMIAVGVTWLGTWEDRSAEYFESAPVSRNPVLLLFANLASTLKVRAFRQHLGMYLAAFISLDVFNAVFPYFVTFVLMGSIAMTGQLVAVQSVGQILGVFAAMALIVRIRPSQTYRLGIMIWAGSLLGLFFLWQAAPAEPWLLLALIVAIAGLARGALAYIPWNLYNFMGDIDQLVMGQRRDGAIAGVMTFTRKAGQAAAVMFIGLVLEANGFVASASSQAPATQTAIGVTMFGAIGLLLGAGWLIAGRFALDRCAHTLVLSVLDGRACGVPPDLSPSETQLLRALTGSDPQVTLEVRPSSAAPEIRM